MTNRRLRFIEGGGKSGLQIITLDDSLAEADNAWTVATYRNQPYNLSSESDAILLPSPGTSFIPVSDHVVRLKEGTIVVMAGQTAVTIVTAFGSIVVPAGSTAGVIADRFGNVRLASLHGDPAAFNLQHRGVEKSVAVALSKEVTVGSAQVASAGGSDYTPLIPSRDDFGGLHMSSSGVDHKSAPYWQRLASADETALSQSAASRLHQVMAAVSSGKQMPKLGGPPSSAGGPLDIHMRPIAHVTTTATNFSRPFDKLETLETDDATVRKFANSIVTSSVASGLSVTSGEALIHARKAVDIKVAHHTVHLAKGTLALISVEGTIAKVRNICNTSSHSMHVVIDNHTVNLLAGQEMVIAPDHAAAIAQMREDRIGRRRIHSQTVAPNLGTATSEFSIVSLLQEDPLMRTIYRSDERVDKVAMDRVLKIGACLFTATNGHGAYERVLASGSRTY